MSHETFSAVAGFSLSRDTLDFPEAAQNWAAWLLLDTLGICIAAAPMQAGVLARQTAVQLYGAGPDAERATMIFDGRPVSLAGAAFAAATQIDNLDGHDGFNPTKGHIGVAVVPALIAVAEQLPDLTGPEALAALVTGYEIAGRAGLSLHATVTDYHTSGAWNALGVTALAARLRRASAGVLRDALGIAEYHGPRSQMMREIANPTMLHDGSGMGAMVGVSALIMAEMGFTGAPAITIEAPEVAHFWTDLGEDWIVTQQYVKPYPICRWAHAPIDAAAHLRNTYGFAHDQIDQIEIRSFYNALQLFPGAPQTTSQAQYSLPFSVAAILVHGCLGLEQISGAGLADNNVAALIQRTKLVEEPRHEARFPEGRWADIAITLKDGRVLESGDTNARGGPNDPYDEAGITEKFMSFAAPVVGDKRARDIADSALGLVQGNSRFSDLSQHLWNAP